MAEAWICLLPYHPSLPLLHMPDLLPLHGSPALSSAKISTHLFKQET